MYIKYWNNNNHTALAQCIDEPFIAPSAWQYPISSWNIPFSNWILTNVAHPHTYLPIKGSTKSKMFLIKRKVNVIK